MVYFIILKRSGIYALIICIINSNRFNCILSNAYFVETLSIFASLSLDVYFKTEMFMHLTSHSFLTDKHYDFNFSKSTADILIVNIEFVCEALEMNG